MGDEGEKEKTGEEGEEQQGGVPIDKANLQQLNMLKNQLEQEIESLTKNNEGLRLASSRFGVSKDCIGVLKPENEGKPILVPMCGAVYMDGKITNTNTVLVDVGTGYFVEKSIEDAQAFCGSREKMLTESVNKVAHVLKQQRKQLEQVSIVMQQKLYALQMQQQQQQEAQAAAA